MPNESTNKNRLFIGFFFISSVDCCCCCCFFSNKRCKNEARLFRFYAVGIEHKQWLIVVIRGAFKHIVLLNVETFLQTANGRHIHQQTCMHECEQNKARAMRPINSTKLKKDTSHLHTFKALADLTQLTVGPWQNKTKKNSNICQNRKKWCRKTKQFAVGRVVVVVFSSSWKHVGIIIVFFFFLQYLPVFFVTLQMLIWFFFWCFCFNPETDHTVLSTLLLYSYNNSFFIFLAIALFFLTLSFGSYMCICFFAFKPIDVCSQSFVHKVHVSIILFVEQLQLTTDTCTFPLGVLWTLLTKMQLSWTKFIVFPNKRRAVHTILQEY